VADAVAPKVVVVENVVGLQDLHGPTHSALVDVLADAGDGYTVATVRLDADYNVPQARERVFVAVREGLPDARPVGTARRLQHRRRRDAHGDFAAGDYDTGATRSTKCPRQSPRRRPADDPVHETIEAVQPGAGEWGRTPRRPSHRGRAPGGRRTIISVPPNHVAPDHAGGDASEVRQWALGYCGSRTTDRRLHPDQPAPTMTISDGVHNQFTIRGRSPSTPGEPASTTCAGSLFARLRGSRRSPIW